MKKLDDLKREVSNALSESQIKGGLLTDVVRAIDYLHSRGYLGGVPEWQDISTAPKDGTDIIVNMPQVESGCTFIYWKDGWRLTYDGKFLAPHVTPPTHWMPLPAAPKGEV